MLWYPEIVPRLRYQVIIIIAVTVLVFSNSLSGRFVMDDTSLVVYNPRVRSVSNIPGMFLGSAFFDPNKNEDQGGQFYRPLVSVAYSLLYALGGSGPWIFHLFQIFMHAANAVLLAHGLAPLSYRSVDENDYREAVFVLYELNSVMPFKKIFIDQYDFAAKNYAVK